MFLIEVNGVPIGECRLQSMNLPDVQGMYNPALDIRRIDMLIGEKKYWGRGIGTQFIGMMLDFAYDGEHVDVLHSICNNYNSSSQPQLYSSEGKLQNVREWFKADDRTVFDPLPLKELDGLLIMADGHTRAVCAYLAGWDEIPVYMDPDELDMEANAKDVGWCEAAAIRTTADLAERIVSHAEYEILWKKRCMGM